MKIISFIKRLLGIEKDVIDRIMKFLPELDPDSTRMVEWIWAGRQQLGLNTYAEDLFLSSSSGVTLENLINNYFYKHFSTYFESGQLFRGLVKTDDGLGVELYLVASLSEDGDIQMAAVGDKALVTGILSRIREEFRVPMSIKIINLLAFTNEGPKTRSYTIQEDPSLLARDEFYPWMEESIDDFAKAFNESNSNVILLIGPPGTGKSTFIRTLLFKMGRLNNKLIDDSNLQRHPNIASWVRSADEDSAIVFEDSDLLVAKREEGNDQMSMLLSFSDGVVKSDTKIIISTNLPSISKVDEALLRPGRNYAILEFRKLYGDEANDIRQLSGLPDLGFNEDARYTLAESLSHGSVSNIEKRKARNIGFIE